MVANAKFFGRKDWASVGAALGKARSRGEPFKIHSEYSIHAIQLSLEAVLIGG
jgi:hypothetical protein